MTPIQKSAPRPDTILFVLLYRAVRPHWRPLAVSLVLLAITAALNVVPPTLLQWAIDGPITTGDTADLWPITILYGGTAVAMFAIQYVYTYYLQKAGQRALSDMRTNLFGRIMEQDQAFFLKNPVGDLVMRLTSDIDTLSALLSTSAVTIVTETATLLVVIVVMFTINWRLALLVIAILPILVFVTRYFSARVRNSSTGAGKTSLIGLLARWYDPQRGRILLDGVDIKSLEPQALRSLVSVIPQDPITFAGDISFNISLYQQLVSEEIRSAAGIANAAHFIERLPEQYHALVTPNGANLSAGERQLLALARAIALQPHGILILDEATSSIDTTTEALVQEALERLFHGRTSIIIAHRLATVRSADRILVIQQGRVVEDGDHTTLIAQNGLYATLYAHQLAD